MRAPSRLVRVLAFVVVLGTPYRASADLIGLSAGMFFCPNPCSGENILENVRNADQSSPYGLAPYIRTGSFDTATLDVTFAGIARTGFGTKGVGLSASFVGDSAMFHQLAFGAGSLDHLWLGHPVYNGSRGHLELDWSLDGSMNDSGRGDAELYIRNCVGNIGTIPLIGNPDVQGATCNLDLFQADIDRYTTSLPYFWGEFFDLRSDLLVFAKYRGIPGPGVGTVDINYSNTMELVGFRAYTEDGTLVPDVEIRSGSGTVYTANGVVPEPASLLLVGTGVAGLAARARWRRRIR